MLVLGRFSQVPLQRTTATIGAFSFTSMPRTAATFFITSLPPTGQKLLSRLGALTHAWAKARQPAYPQPPQLAPGITFSTSSIRGSSSTLNFFATRKRTTDSRSPRRVTATIVQIIVVVIFYNGLIDFPSFLHRQILYIEHEILGQPVPEQEYHKVIKGDSPY